MIRQQFPVNDDLQFFAARFLAISEICEAMEADNFFPSKELTGD
jgi:hypothetical protein